MNLSSGKSYSGHTHILIISPWKFSPGEQQQVSNINLNCLLWRSDALERESGRKGERGRDRILIKKCFPEETASSGSVIKAFQSQHLSPLIIISNY